MSASRLQKNTVLALSLDFDGCLALSQSLFPKLEENPALLLENNQPLVDYIVVSLRANPQITRLIVLVGSARQSYRANKRGMENNQNGSCFHLIPLFLELLKEKIGKDFPHVYFEFDPILTADIYGGTPLGENFRHATNETVAQQEGYSFSSVCPDESKLFIAYIHLHYLLSLKLKEIGACEVRYEHVDDNSDILQGLLRFFSKHAHFIPEQVTFRAHQLFKGTTIESDGTRCPVSFFQSNYNDLAIQGTGEIDLAFSVTVKRMAQRISTLNLPPADKPWPAQVCKSLPAANAIELLPSFSRDDLRQLRHAPSVRPPIASAVTQPVVIFPLAYKEEEIHVAMTLALMQHMLHHIHRTTIGTVYIQITMQNTNLTPLPPYYCPNQQQRFDEADKVLGERLKLRETRQQKLKEIYTQLEQNKTDLQEACAKISQYNQISTIPDDVRTDIEAQLEKIGTACDSVIRWSTDPNITQLETENKQDEVALAQWQSARKTLETGTSPLPPTETLGKSAPSLTSAALQLLFPPPPVIATDTNSITPPKSHVMN
jgi:hypothetical protein